MNSTITISSDGMNLLPDSSKNPVNRQSGYHPISLPKGKSYRNILSKFCSVTRLSKLPSNRSLASSIPIGSISGSSHSPGSRPQCQRQLPVRYSALSFFREKPPMAKAAVCRSSRSTPFYSIQASERRKAGARLTSETGDLLPDVRRSLHDTVNSRAWFLLLLRRSERGSSVL